jgi:hypothetical protein
VTSTLKPSTAAPWQPPAPDLPPPRVPDAVRQAHNADARPASIARDIMAEVEALAAPIAANPHLTPAGQRAEFTRLAVPKLRLLAEQRAALEASAKQLQQEASALDAPATAPTLSEPELARQLAAAVRFASLPSAQQTAWIAEAMTGKSPLKLAALVNEDPAITGLAPEQHARLQRIQREAMVDHAARERLTARAELIRESRTVVERAIRAIEDAADRAALREAKLATLRRSDFQSDAEKAAYIGRFGLAAYQALPA